MTSRERVTVESFARAETNRMMANLTAGSGGINQVHHSQPALARNARLEHFDGSERFLPHLIRERAT